MRNNVSKSAVVKEALEQYFQKNHENVSPFKAGEDLFGLDGAASPNLSTGYKKRLKKKIDEKHTH